MIVDVYIFRLGRLVQTTEPLSCRVIASEICDSFEGVLPRKPKARPQDIFIKQC